MQSSLLVLIWILSWCGLDACHACHDKAKVTENGLHLRLLFVFFGIGDFAGSSVRKMYFFHLFAKSPLLVCHFQRLHLSSSFHQNWFYFFRTSIAKVIAFPVCEIEVDPFPFGFYNILLGYDVSLHNLVVLDVTIPTIPTSPRLSKTEFICKSYGVLISLFGSGPEMVRSLRPQRTRNLRSLFFAAECLAVVRYWTGVRRHPGDGTESPGHRSLRSKGPGISGLRFSRLFCIFVVRYWIGVRNIPGECPEYPAWPDSPDLWTGISGLPR